MEVLLDILIESNRYSIDAIGTGFYIMHTPEDERALDAIYIQQYGEQVLVSVDSEGRVESIFEEIKLSGKPSIDFTFPTETLINLAEEDVEMCYATMVNGKISE